MREIKFRAWSENKMHHFDLSDTIAPFLENNVMQFTGLKDKNGKEIYEGDIVNRFHLKGTVCFDELRAMFIINDGFKIPLFNEIYGVEVIGNIHENPELL
jgi:uncharacterized phage protein (TIGR01671 family)